MKVIIKKIQDVTGDYWAILNENGIEIFSYCRETALYDGDEKSGGYTYGEVKELIKRNHPEWDFA